MSSPSSSSTTSPASVDMQDIEYDIKERSFQLRKFMKHIISKECKSDVLRVQLAFAKLTGFEYVQEDNHSFVVRSDEPSDETEDRKSIGESLFEEYIYDNIISKANLRFDHKFFSSCSIVRTTSVQAADKGFVGMRCNRCKIPHLNIQEAYDHMSSCYNTCGNGCCALLNSSVKWEKRDIQYLHDQECIKKCQGVTYDMNENGRAKRNPEVKATCNYIFLNYKDMVRHLQSCPHVQSSIKQHGLNVNN